jgi:hypothetical protein
MASRLIDAAYINPEVLEGVCCRLPVTEQDLVIASLVLAYTRYQLAVRDLLAFSPGMR